MLSSDMTLGLKSIMHLDRRTIIENYASETGYIYLIVMDPAQANMRLMEPQPLSYSIHLDLKLIMHFAVHYDKRNNPRDQTLPIAVANNKTDISLPLTHMSLVQCVRIRDGTPPQEPDLWRR